MSLTRSPVTGYASQTIGFHQPQQGRPGKTRAASNRWDSAEAAAVVVNRFASMMSCPWPKHEQLGKFSQLFDVGRDEGE